MQHSSFSLEQHLWSDWARKHSLIKGKAKAECSRNNICSLALSARFSLF